MSKPHIMRMVVVLPLPFGPRNPKISPRRTRMETLFTTCLSPKVLVQALHVDGVLGIGGCRHCSVTSSGWPGCRRGALSTDGLAMTMKTSLERFSLL